MFGYSFFFFYLILPKSTHLKRNTFALSIKIDVESHSTHLLIEHQAKWIFSELTIRMRNFCSISAIDSTCDLTLVDCYEAADSSCISSLIEKLLWIILFCYLDSVEVFVLTALRSVPCDENDNHYLTKRHTRISIWMERFVFNWKMNEIKTKFGFFVP